MKNTDLRATVLELGLTRLVSKLDVRDEGTGKKKQHRFRGKVLKG